MNSKTRRPKVRTALAVSLLAFLSWCSIAESLVTFTATAIMTRVQFVPLPPISNRDFFYGGSDIPVKFQLFDLDGKIIDTVSATLFVDGLPATPEPGSSGNTFAFDAKNRQYLYILNTKPLSAPGPHVIAIFVDASLAFSKTISLY